MRQEIRMTLKRNYAFTSLGMYFGRNPLVQTFIGIEGISDKLTRKLTFQFYNKRIFSRIVCGNIQENLHCLAGNINFLFHLPYLAKINKYIQHFLNLKVLVRLLLANLRIEK